MPGLYHRAVSGATPRGRCQHRRRMTHGRAVAGLVLVTLVWGVTFSVVKGALADASPLVLVAVRFGLASLLVLPFARGMTRAELRGGALLGLFFWSGIAFQDRKSTRLNSSHVKISYAVFCLKKKS